MPQHQKPHLLTARADLRVYVTFCSRKKDEALRRTGTAVRPCLLYRGNRISGFMERCKRRHLHWAIFSDKYGIWFPHEEREYYKKSPIDVSQEEFSRLLEDFDSKLRSFDEICFYYGTAENRVHGLYKRLLRETSLRTRIRIIKRAEEIR